MKGVTIENEYAYISEGKVFLKGYNGMPDRQIGEVKRTEEEAFQYFVNRYDIAESKVNQLKEEIEEAQNKGSFLTKLIQLRKRLLNFDGIGNFLPLLAILDEQEKVLTGLIDENQSNNLVIKNELIAEAQKYTDSEDWRDTSDILQEIRTRWIRTGPVEKELNIKLEDQFKELLDNFYQRRKVFFDEQNKIIDDRIAKYNELIHSADALCRRSDWDEAFSELKDLQTQWKAIGEVPPKLLKSQYKHFKRFTTLFYDKYCRAKGITQKKRVDPRIEAQIRMVKEAEMLTTQDDIFDATNRAKVLLNEWKNIKVPSHVADRNIAERFRGACDKIFELSYLMKVITRKHPTYNFLSDKQKDLTKYREMDNIVRRARQDLQLLIESVEATGSQGPEMDQMTQSNLRTQKRKLLMKEVILEELRQRVANL